MTKVNLSLLRGDPFESQWHAKQVERLTLDTLAARCGGSGRHLTCGHQKVQHRGRQESQAACQDEGSRKARHISGVSAHQGPHDPPQRQEALADAHGRAKEVTVRKEAASMTITSNHVPCLESFSLLHGCF